MRPILLLILLCLFSNSASAEWVRVGVRFFDGTEFNDELGEDNSQSHESYTAFTVYANLSTMRKSGQKIKLWSLANLSKPMKVADKPFLSIVSHDEFDCKAKVSRSLSFTYSSEIMGKGEVILSSTQATAWYPIKPASVTEIGFQAACKKQRFIPQKSSD
jgi:hypothetical protein